MRPADKVPRFPPAAVGLGLLHCYLALQSPMCIPSPSRWVIVSGEEAAHQVPPQAFNPLLPDLLLTAPVGQSGVGSMAALGGWFGLAPGACCRLYLLGDQQHPLAGLSQAMLSLTATFAEGGCCHCHLSVCREGPEGFRC